MDLAARRLLFSLIIGWLAFPIPNGMANRDSVDERIKEYYHLGLSRTDQQAIVDQLLEEFEQVTHPRIRSALVGAVARLNFNTYFVSSSPHYASWWDTILDEIDLASDSPTSYADDESLELLHATLALAPMAKYWRDHKASQVDTALKLIWLFDHYGFDFARPPMFDALITEPVSEKIDVWFDATSETQKFVQIKKLIEVTSVKRTPTVTSFVLTYMSEKPELLDYLAKEKGVSLSPEQLEQIYKAVLLLEDSSDHFDSLTTILGQHCGQDEVLRHLFRSALEDSSAEVKGLWPTVIGKCQNKSWGKELYQLMSAAESDEQALEWAETVFYGYAPKRSHSEELFHAMITYLENHPAADFGILDFIFQYSQEYLPAVNQRIQSFAFARIHHADVSFEHHAQLVSLLSETGYFRGPAGKERLSVLITGVRNPDSVAKRVALYVAGRAENYQFEYSTADLTTIKWEQLDQFSARYWKLVSETEFDAESPQFRRFLNIVYRQVFGNDESTCEIDTGALSFLMGHGRIYPAEIKKIKGIFLRSLKDGVYCDFDAWGRWLAQNLNENVVKKLYHQIKPALLEPDRAALADRVPADENGDDEEEESDEEEEGPVSTSLLEKGAEILAPLAINDEQLALDLYETCSDPLYRDFGSTCRDMNQPFTSTSRKFYEVITRDHFQHADPQIRLWLGQLLTLGLDEQPQLREAIGQLWLEHKGRYYSSRDVAKLACGMAKPTMDWFNDEYFTNGNSLGTPTLTLQAAASALQLLYLTRAAQQCDELAGLADHLRALFGGEQIDNPASGMSELAMKRVQQLLEGIEHVIERNRDLAFGSNSNPGDHGWTDVPYSTFDQYALQFYISIIQSLGLSQADLAKPDLYKDGVAMQLRMLRSLHSYSREGSFMTMYAYATALLNINYGSEDLILHLHDIAGKIASQPLAVPYDPRVDRITRHPRDAVARSPIFYLVLYKHQNMLDRRDPGHGRNYRQLLLDSLEYWDEHVDDVILNSYRSGYHLGKNHLGSHYFYPCLPYVAQAVRELHKDEAALSVEDKILLEGVTLRVQQVLADATRVDGQAYPWGGVDGQPRYWPDGPAYASALLGMAMLEVGDL